MFLTSRQYVHWKIVDLNFFRKKFREKVPIASVNTIVKHQDYYKVSLKMLIENLLDNAIRYSTQGGCVTTRLERTDNIILSVEDEGSGIPSEERDLVLQRFYRILGNDSEGSGLGLSIVAEIAKSHAANIVIDDPKNHKGTIVMIIFQPV